MGELSVWELFTSDFLECFGVDFDPSDCAGVGAGFSSGSTIGAGNRGELNNNRKPMKIMSRRIPFITRSLWESRLKSFCEKQKKRQYKSPSRLHGCQLRHAFMER